MKLEEAIYGRRSIRRYKSEDVPHEVIMKAIDMARHAPSAGNLQPWEFIIVKDEEIKKGFTELVSPSPRCFRLPFSSWCALIS